MACAPAKKNRKSFQRHWYDTDESLKYWLEEVSSNESKCFCKVCNKTLVCGLSKIRKHSFRHVHIANMQKTFAVNSDRDNDSNLSVEGQFD